MLCLFGLKFDDLVNTIKLMSSRPVNLITLFLDKV